jgi:16S rRNA (cytosine1402-N4)-methyltransferase
MAQEPEHEDHYHRPVLADEVVALFGPVQGGVVVDATFGGGGHAKRLMEELNQVTVIGIDRDPAARARGQALGIDVLAGSFADLRLLLERAGIGSVAGVLFDFGVSSHQLDQAGRGFSYRFEGPLDMRMDPGQSLTAADIVNTWGERELAGLIRRLGEEPHAGRIARAIVAARPMTTTLELAAAVSVAVPAAVRRKGHPARKTFQAIRIAVNEELDAIVEGLDAALAMLQVDGRVVTIAYHSLEDRIVKRRFAAEVAGCVCPPGLPVCGCDARVEFRLLGTARPSPAEVATNPRARSARLRAIERIAA